MRDRLTGIATSEDSRHLIEGLPSSVLGNNDYVKDDYVNNDYVNDDYAES